MTTPICLNLRSQVAETFLRRQTTPQRNLAGTDTELFLFDSTGHAIASDDDASGLTLTSTLPAHGTFTASLSPGTYYLGISASGNEAVNSTNNLLFNRDNQNYVSTDVVGPATAINPTTLAGFNSNAYDEAYLLGAYEIDLTGAASEIVVSAPEPTIWAMLLMGGAVGCLFFWRRKHAC